MTLSSRDPQDDDVIMDELCMLEQFEKGNFWDHLLINTSGTKQWSKFSREIEAVELARLNSRPTPMDLSAVGYDQQPTGFEGNCSWCGVYGHMARDCWKKLAAQSQSGKDQQSWNISQWSQWRDTRGGKDQGRDEFESKLINPTDGRFCSSELSPFNRDTMDLHEEG